MILMIYKTKKLTFTIARSVLQLIFFVTLNSKNIIEALNIVTSYNISVNIFGENVSIATNNSNHAGLLDTKLANMNELFRSIIIEKISFFVIT